MKPGLDLWGILFGNGVMQGRTIPTRSLSPISPREGISFPRPLPLPPLAPFPPPTFIVLVSSRPNDIAE